MLQQLAANAAQRGPHRAQPLDHPADDEQPEPHDEPGDGRHRDGREVVAAETGAEVHPRSDHGLSQARGAERADQAGGEKGALGGREPQPGHGHGRDRLHHDRRRRTPDQQHGEGEAERRERFGSATHDPAGAATVARRR